MEIILSTATLVTKARLPRARKNRAAAALPTSPTDGASFSSRWYLMVPDGARPRSVGGVALEDVVAEAHPRAAVGGGKSGAISRDRRPGHPQDGVAAAHRQSFIRVIGHRGVANHDDGSAIER